MTLLLAVCADDAVVEVLATADLAEPVYVPNSELLLDFV